MPRYILTTPAQADLRAIKRYLRWQSPSASRRVGSELGRAFRRLAESPGIGHTRAELADERFRFWQVYSYLVMYRPDARPLEVIRVLHGARDVARIMSVTD